MLRGVDISGYQSADFDFSSYDFGIIKVSEGIGVPSSVWKQQADKCLSQGKLLGFYHYCHPELNSTPDREVNDFVGRIRPYIGKAILALDWEGDSLGQPISWAKKWLDLVQSQTGIRPFLYTSSSVTHSYDWSSVAAKYPLWLAQYTSGQPSWSYWDKWTIWQYTDRPVDTNYFDGTASEWNNLAGNIHGKWISSNSFLNQAEMENNAEMVWAYFRYMGWSLEATCAMLGNMQSESTINPGIWENLDAWPSNPNLGAGLVGWTPYRRITDWLAKKGYAWGDGNGECAKLDEEMRHPEIEVTWIPTEKYPMTFKEFAISHEDPEYLALAFLANYERPANPNQPQRGTQAKQWYAYLKGAPVFKPRMDASGIRGSPYWYSNNPFYQAGYGLPNCTCYVWGRWFEITGIAPNLPLGNANTWFDTAKGMGLKVGSIPALGSIICTWYADGGHVAIVEQINEDGSIIVSNSGWPSTFFWIETLYPPNYLAPWMPGNAYVQGFIYLTTQPTPPEPSKPVEPEPISEDHKWVYYLKPM